jgi:hypothetical protein
MPGTAAHDESISVSGNALRSMSPAAPGLTRQGRKERTNRIHRQFRSLLRFAQGRWQPLPGDIGIFADGGNSTGAGHSDAPSTHRTYNKPSTLPARADPA